MEMDKDTPAVLPPPPPPLPMQNSPPTQTVFRKKRNDIHRQFEDYVDSILFDFNNNVHSAILQEGPTCGLVALSMALATRTEPGPDVRKLLHVANELKYSKQGEMFSAAWMKDLAVRFGASATLIQGGLDKHLQCIADCLLNGGLVLVPYDSDFNFRPCCKSGHKAHWALIFGLYVCSFTSSPSNVPNISIELCNCSNHESNDSQPVFPVLGNTSPFGVSFSNDKFNVRPLTTKVAQQPAVTIFVSAVEGKSIGTMTWPFADLVASNSNLAKLCPKRDALVHVLPPGGVTAGLQGQAVLLHLNRCRVTAKLS